VAAGGQPRAAAAAADGLAGLFLFFFNFFCFMNRGKQ
jgi:hypothetical protein